MSSSEDKCSSQNLLKNRLPMDGSSLDYRLLPYIGNGHLATVVYSDFVYMNGFYNGDQGLYILFVFCFLVIVFQ